MPDHFIHFSQGFHYLFNPVVIDHKDYCRCDEKHRNIPYFMLRYGTEGLFLSNVAHHRPARAFAADSGHQIIQPVDPKNILFMAVIYHLLCFFLHLGKLFPV